MPSRLRRWLALPGAERCLFLQLMLGLPMVAGLLRVLGFVRTQSWLKRLAGNYSARVANATDLAQAERMAALAAIAGRRGLLSATCLRQALLVEWLLRRRGLAPELKLGVRKHDGHFDAHAWVELEGVALAQAGLDHQAFSARESGTT